MSKKLHAIVLASTLTLTTGCALWNKIFPARARGKVTVQTGPAAAPPPSAGQVAGQPQPATPGAATAAPASAPAANHGGPAPSHGGPAPSSDPGTPAAGPGGGAPAPATPAATPQCNGDWTLGRSAMINSRVGLGHACNARLSNCRDGYYIKFAGGQCKCILSCNSLRDSRTGVSCTKDGQWTCQHIQATNASGNSARVCAYKPWNLCQK